MNTAQNGERKKWTHTLTHTNIATVSDKIEALQIELKLKQK